MRFPLDRRANEYHDTARQSRKRMRLVAAPVFSRSPFAVQAGDIWQASRLI
jgi:hypothetical protein